MVFWYCDYHLDKEANHSEIYKLAYISNKECSFITSIIALLDPTIAIVAILLLFIIESVYWYIAKTPLEVLIASSNERLKYHIWRIVSMSCIITIILSIIILLAQTYQYTTVESATVLSTSGTDTFLFELAYRSIAIGQVFITIFVIITFISMIIYVSIQTFKMKITNHYCYQITIDNTAYKIVKGLSNGLVLLTKITENNHTEYQIVKLESLELANIIREKTKKQR